MDKCFAYGIAHIDTCTLIKMLVFSMCLCKKKRVLCNYVFSLHVSPHHSIVELAIMTWIFNIAGLFSLGSLIDVLPCSYYLEV